MVVALIGLQVYTVFAKNEGKGKRAEKKEAKRAKRIGNIPAGMSENDLLLFLREQRSKQVKKSHDLKSWYTMLVANTSTKPIVVKYKSGWTAEDVVIVTGVAVGVAAAIVLTAGTASTMAAGMAVPGGTAGAVVGGAVAGSAAAAGTEAAKIGKHAHIILPGTYQIFRRPQTVEKVRFIIKPSNMPEACGKDSKHVSLNVNNKHNITIISQVSADGCSIKDFTTTGAKAVKKMINTPEVEAEDETEADENIDVSQDDIGVEEAA